MIIVYSDNHTVSFNDSIEEDIENTRNIRVTSFSDVSTVVENVKSGNYDGDINLYGYNIDIMYNDFCSLYSYIEAAGGVVRNSKSEFLLIKRFGIWDLPKGKIEKGETTNEAAIREVREETGLNNIIITLSLPDTYHIYFQRKKWWLKKTYWFLMESKKDEKLVPETKEDITEAIWMKKQDAKLAMSNSYRSLKDGLGYLF